MPATPSPSSSNTSPSTSATSSSTSLGLPFDSVDTPDPVGKADRKVTSARPGVTLRMGQVGTRISRVHDELAWLGHTVAKAEKEQARFGPTTREAIRAFQTKHWVPATGKVDKRTWRLLNRLSAPIDVLPRTCTTEPMTICIDKTAKVLRLVDHGEVILTTDARFGAPGMETGEGIFTIHEKSRNHISSRYHTWMPFAMFFNGDEAVHYSPDFNAVGYLHGSHGCVGVRDIDKAEWLFDRVPVGTRVYVYWS